jgi:hypothetical protein
MRTSFVFLVFTVSLTFAACDKNDDDPSPADFARCAHIDRTDTVWGEFYYDVCLNNPWPTELPSATQEGLSTFGGIINDTLLFVAGSPRSFPDETARAKLTYLRGGGASPTRLLLAGFGTYDAIDSSGIRIGLPLLPTGVKDPLISSGGGNELRVTRHDPSINGVYYLDTTRYLVEIQAWNDSVVAGTIDAWFIHAQDLSKQIHLSEGRFDLTVQP